MMDTLGGVSRILAVRLGGIGDIVLAIPALHRIRHALGASSLTLLTDTRYVPLVELIPDIGGAIAVDRIAMESESWVRRGRDLIDLGLELRSRRFDLAIDLHGFPESNLFCGFSGARHRIGICRSDKVYLHACFDLEPARVDPGMHLEDVYAAAAGRLVGEAGHDESRSPLLEVPAALRAWARQTLGPGPIVSLFVGASRRKHRWTVPGFAEVARFARAGLGASVSVLAGTTPVEKALAEEILAEVAGDRIRLLKDRTLSELAAVISESDLLVSNDSGPMHIGSAQGIPTVGIMTTNSAIRYAPRGPHTRCIDARRLTEIDPDRIVQAMAAIWSGRKEHIS